MAAFPRLTNSARLRLAGVGPSGIETVNRGLQACVALGTASL